jgi:hypothetical protein
MITFTRTDAAEWVAITEIGDYTITFDDEMDTFTLYFLPTKAGSLAQTLATDVHMAYLKELAAKHYGGSHG